MTGILAEIVEYKRSFVVESRRRLPLRELEVLALESSAPRGFADAISVPGCSLIAEIKTASPSKGVIRDGFDPVTVAGVYEGNGAACISVLTDERYFHGSLDRLRIVREAVDIPVIRKDFIIDPYQIFEARYAGADAVLLIAACLDDKTLGELVELAALNGMDALLEVHDQSEMDRAARVDTRLIGINNRDLATFVTDIETTNRLARYSPADAILVSESGIHTADDVRKVHSAGASAVLVGESIMRETDMAAKVCELSGAVW